MEEGGYDINGFVIFSFSLERVEDVRGSFSSRTVKVFTWIFWIALVAVCVLGISFYVYKKRQEDSKKRFY